MGLIRILCSGFEDKDQVLVGSKVGLGLALIKMVLVKFRFVLEIGTGRNLDLGLIWFLVWD